MCGNQGLHSIESMDQKCRDNSKKLWKEEKRDAGLVGVTLTIVDVACMHCM